jgi:ubiquinone/menaquinone biosynthesis C-methylase UbiE
MRPPGLLGENIMRIALPQRAHIAETTTADPLKFYYLPIARSFYVARFADALRLLTGPVGSLLEVGCGSGIFLTELAKHCKQLHGCDRHSNLHLTRAMLRREKVEAEICQADAAALPYASESMDAIVCMSVLEHIRDLEAPAEEFYRVLRPGGIGVIGVPVTNLLTEAMLRVSYLSFEARLEDEHVSTHRQVFAVFGRRFMREQGLHIPRLLPEWLRMYSSARFRKAAGQAATSQKTVGKVPRSRYVLENEPEHKEARELYDHLIGQR